MVKFNPILVNVGQAKVFMTVVQYSAGVLLAPFYTIANQIPLSAYNPSYPTYPYDPHWVSEIGTIFTELGIIPFDYYSNNVYDNNWTTELDSFQNLVLPNLDEGKATYLNYIWLREDFELIGWAIGISSVPIPPPPTHTDTIGGTDGYVSNLSGYVVAFQITASNSGTLSSVGINVYHQSGSIATAIYSDVSGIPGTLIGQSASVFPFLGWNDLSLAGTIVAGKQYWLAFQCSSSGLEPYVSTATGTEYYYSQSFGLFPSSPSWSSHGIGPVVNLRMKYG